MLAVLSLKNRGWLFGGTAVPFYIDHLAAGHDTKDTPNLGLQGTRRTGPSERGRKGNGLVQARGGQAAWLADGMQEQYMTHGVILTRSTVSRGGVDVRRGKEKSVCFVGFGGSRMTGCCIGAEGWTWKVGSCGELERWKRHAGMTKTKQSGDGVPMRLLRYA